VLLLECTALIGELPTRQRRLLTRTNTIELGTYAPQRLFSSLEAVTPSLCQPGIRFLCSQPHLLTHRPALPPDESARVTPGLSLTLHHRLPRGSTTDTDCRLRGWCVCRACREFATILHRDLAPVLDEMDCKLLVVSIGTAARAKQFVAETGFPLERVSE